MRTTWRSALLIALQSVTAVGAWAGTVGFATGAFDDLVEQLPWSSRTVAAVALAVCIAVPTTVATIALLQRTAWAAQAALLTAAVLAAWLLGQTVFVGFSAFQPAFLVVAGAIAVLALQRDLVDVRHQPAVLRSDAPATAPR